MDRITNYLKVCLCADKLCVHAQLLSILVCVTFLTFVTARQIGKVNFITEKLSQNGTLAVIKQSVAMMSSILPEIFSSFPVALPVNNIATQTTEFDTTAIRARLKRGVEKVESTGTLDDQEGIRREINTSPKFSNSAEQPEIVEQKPEDPASSTRLDPHQAK